MSTGSCKYVPNMPKEAINTSRRIKMDKYECPCGYVYDPAEGDPDNGVAPGTSWDNLPEDWVCPLCGAAQEDFEKLAD